MTDFSFSTSISLMRRTAAFVLFRMAVYFGIAVAYVLATGAGAGIGWGVGAFGDAEFRAGATFWGGGIGFAATAAVLYFLREYILYTVKAGHIAVMVELLDNQTLPQGRGQIAHAQNVVKERFAQSSTLFGLDQLIKGVLRTITGLIQGLASILPIPGTDGLMRIVRGYLKVAVGLIDEVILAHLIRTRSVNPWKDAQSALVLYAQNAKPMLINAAVITLVSWLLAFVVFLIMLAPAGAVVYMIPGAWSAGGFVFAILFAWAVKVALIEPFAIACLLQAFFKVTDGQVPNPEWEAKLESASTKFRKLGERAVNWATGGRAAEQGAEPPT
ncbi:hypothetical protein [Roseovarius pelagicus]|uniref:Uncharacterized protein n=1 Tax=Roseovarius pelagicus TaxID=2980108 RepID=A0ABY6DF84_9RHOB|nr:hypothetical protein [Roseovarius pelagicus]UXX84730.1 hypothetical protein N7U68_08875 [Roseovarius pelagicus]